MRVSQILVLVIWSKHIKISKSKGFSFVLYRSTSRKRTASSKAEASVLKESLAAPLSPVPELSTGTGHNSSRDLSSVGVTPIQKKKRKLYKQTPQLSEVYI